MKLIKHSKLKNPAILFEALSTKMVNEVLSGSINPTALVLIKRYFNDKTELSKEFDLYKAIVEHKTKDNVLAVDFINETKKFIGQLNLDKLDREKYLLVRDIKKRYNLSDTKSVNDFFKIKVENYKIYASIYKIVRGSNNPAELVDYQRSRDFLIEHFARVEQKKEESLLDIPADLRELTLKFMVEKFNRKYGDLCREQKKILRLYITDLEALKTYLVEEKDQITSMLQFYANRHGSENEILKIKLNEMTELIGGFNPNKMTDDHVIGFMRSYSLLSELEKI